MPQPRLANARQRPAELLRDNRRWWLIAGGLIAVILCAWAAHGVALNNYDTAYSLLWGRDLAGGHLPDYDVGLAPTPHPLATLFGLILALPGRGAAPYSQDAVWVWMTLAYLMLLVLAALVFALGRAWFGTAAGILAAIIVLTREPILSFGLRAYVDLPYVCLLLAALLIETRRRRAGTPVLVLVALAGLLRPEAWLFGLLYAAWLWRGGALRPQHVALACAAPILWALSDLTVTGDPLHSLLGTRENAGELGRKTGLDDLPLYGPRRLGEIVRGPVLLGAIGGIVLGLTRLRSRAALGLVALAAALVGFCLLAIAGLPIITRYMLLPGALLSIFCGLGAFGWLALERDDPTRGWAALFGALTLVVMIAFAPSQARRIDRLDAALDRQSAILDELRGFVAGSAPFVDPARCAPLTLPNRRAVPQLALWSGLSAASIRSGQDDGIRGTYFEPISSQVARDFVLDRRDLNRRLPTPQGRTGDLPVLAGLSKRRLHAVEIS